MPCVCVLSGGQREAENVGHTKSPERKSSKAREASSEEGVGVKGCKGHDSWHFFSDSFVFILLSSKEHQRQAAKVRPPANTVDRGIWTSTIHRSDPSRRHRPYSFSASGCPPGTGCWGAAWGTKTARSQPWAGFGVQCMYLDYFFEIVSRLLQGECQTALECELSYIVPEAKFS